MMMREREGRVILMVALPKAGVGQGLPNMESKLHGLNFLFSVHTVSG